MLRDRAELAATMNAYSDSAGTYNRPALFFDAGFGHNRYRGYPIHTLLCTDAIWREPLHTFAGRGRL